MSEAKKTGLSNDSWRQEMRREAQEAPAKRDPSEVHWYFHDRSKRSAASKRVRAVRIVAASVSFEVNSSFTFRDAISDANLDLITGRRRADSSSELAANAD